MGDKNGTMKFLKIAGVVILLVGAIASYIYAEGTASRKRDIDNMRELRKEDIAIRKEQATMQKETNGKLGEILRAIGRLEGRIVPARTTH